MDFKVVQIPVGEGRNFSYIVYCAFTHEGIIVDPSTEPEKVLAEAAKLDLRIKTLVNTHGHGDHTAGNAQVQQKTRAKLAAHPLDLPDADLPLEEGTSLILGGGTISIMHTPGHSPGSICLRVPDGVITGDTLFVRACGRADFANANPHKLYQSLRRLASLPPATIVYPGHDYGPTPTSTIEEECAQNPYLLCPDEESFLKLRMNY